MKRRSAAVLIVSMTWLTTGCVVIEDGEVGISKSFGEISDEPLLAGVAFVAPVIRTVETWIRQAADEDGDSTGSVGPGTDRRTRHHAPIPGAAGSSCHDSQDGRPGLHEHLGPPRFPEHAA